MIKQIKLLQVTAPETLREEIKTSRESASPQVTAPETLRQEIKTSRESASPQVDTPRETAPPQVAPQVAMGLLEVRYWLSELGVIDLHLNFRRGIWECSISSLMQTIHSSSDDSPEKAMEYAIRHMLENPSLVDKAASASATESMKTLESLKAWRIERASEIEKIHAQLRKIDECIIAYVTCGEANLEEHQP